jgi:nucleoside phosphorylase
MFEGGPNGPPFSMSGPILIQVAMAAEAQPIAAALALRPAGQLHANLPALLFEGEQDATRLVLVTHGHDVRFKVDAIGTQPAALTAFAAATRFKPRLFINAGTAGGFARHGAHIGDVYLSEGPVNYHHRRIPLGDFDPYGRGSYPSLAAAALATKLGLKLGKLTTGDSLDTSPEDARAIEASGAMVKDMEAAAIAHVAELFAIPFLGVKSITDLVDADHPTAAQFVKNLDHAVSNLASVMPAIIAELAAT